MGRHDWHQVGMTGTNMGAAFPIVEDGRRDVGRLYEDRHSRPELRWFWSITVYINPNLGITTSGRAPTMNEAKEHFLRNWQKCRRA